MDRQDGRHRLTSDRAAAYELENTNTMATTIPPVRSSTPFFVRLPFLAGAFLAGAAAIAASVALFGGGVSVLEQVDWPPVPLSIWGH